MAAITSADVLRIKSMPGLHGCHCIKCDRLFDAFDAPLPMDEAVMRMATIRCPACGKRKHLVVMMHHRYVEMAQVALDEETERERVRQVADRYMPRG
jgi:DNA-directed RNA polymerase subunit RPC12/RpoP